MRTYEIRYKKSRWGNGLAKLPLERLRYAMLARFPYNGAYFEKYWGKR